MENRLKVYMKDHGITQTKLAEMSGVTQEAISKYVNGKRGLHSYSVVMICKALNVSADWLLGLKDGEEECQ